MFRWIIAAMFLVTLGLAPLAAQDDATPPRAETGGAQTLEDILRRQKGEDVDLEFRRNATGDPATGANETAPLGTRGFASDPELWRSLRFGDADISTQVKSPGADMLVQDGGMEWLLFREGPLSRFGSTLLVLTTFCLFLFLITRGRIRIAAGRSDKTITRFNAIERFAHWLLAGSFILLGVTGLISLFGRKNLIPMIGHDAYSTIAYASKWVHNNVSWAFMLALILVFVFWVIHNLPSRTDLVWIAKGGGMFSDAHPPAKKFNAGQKVVFWSVILLGGSISLSGLSLLFPFEIQLFAPTFEKLNAIGAPGWIGMDPLPETLTPHAEMQLSQLWHAIVSFVLMAVIIAHIYIGTVGMEGAYDAMGTGEVDLNWAKEHHSIWAEKMESKGSNKATPAE